jgi:hypothetical protein
MSNGARRGADPLALERGQGAQERSVPVTKGCIPNAPTGGHKTHPGAPLEGAVVALPEDPPEPARDDDVERVVLPTPLDRVPPPVPPTDAAPPVVPVPEAPVPAAPVVAGAKVELVVAAGLAEGAVITVEVTAPVPRLTTPLRVTLPGEAAVCAKAGRATAIDNSAA